ncbi:pyridoxamine 5'-phosphate oxidase family protein [Acidiferrimicrobium sp. IK]|uniref:pyridoxamine 5'-phosphate oxidase family protein n=1 Tax=Acidiferrimicrobium sp. IK TaxID=2871700 RepID=UPI0021CB08C1|nr:pyridoxamine 5'-phosphate oxidase family protein [Acidiferrimicrobium sp. IK]MCU4183234.1 pyridoxamine 5'-phosphate oxidase family protein [Acidiferrimicrobium sp. IK]
MSETRRPTVRMNDEELWAFVRDGHTGVLTTLKADGSPVALPVWYAFVGGAVYTTTRGKKLLRVRRNPVSSFLVEDGERWAELRAVHMSGHAEIVDPDADLQAAIDAEMARKYAGFRTAPKKMPDATRSHYAAESAVVRFTPDGKVLNWNNAHLGVDQ